MVALKLPESGFKGLLNLVRERIKHVYRIIFTRYSFKKVSSCSSFLNTITHTSKFKSISKYQFSINVSFVDLCKLWSFCTSLWSRWNIIRDIVPFAIAELGHKCLKPAATLKYESLNSCITVLTVWIMKIFKCYASEHL